MKYYEIIVTTNCGLYKTEMIVKCNSKKIAKEFANNKGIKVSRVSETFEKFLPTKNANVYEVK